MTEAKKDAPSPESTRNVLTEDMPKPPAGGQRRRSEKQQRQGPFVKYVGNASNRVVRKHDWKSLGIEGDDVSWDLKNDYIVESSNLSDEQLDYLLIDDMQGTGGSGGHSFLEVNYDSDGNLVQVTDD